jgi:hypothetical protein
MQSNGKTSVRPVRSAATSMRRRPISDGAARNGSAVVRKDYRVLLVDVSRLPARFGKPIASRSDMSAGVAGVIMGCWTGA